MGLLKLLKTLFSPVSGAEIGIDYFGTLFVKRKA
jgi:hypothetical protein